MKLNEEFVLRQVADVWVVLPLGETSINFNGMLKLNESGMLLWKELERKGNRESLADMLTQTYTVDRVQALNDVDEFLDKLRKLGCLEA